MSEYLINTVDSLLQHREIPHPVKLIADGRQSFTFAAWTDRYHCPC